MTKVQGKTAGGVLLPIAAIMLRLMTILLWVALAAVAIAIPGILLNQAEVMRELAGQGLAGDPATLLPRLMALLSGAAVVIGLAIAFFTLLHRIARTVQAGDPFIPDNADRLRLMAWLFLAMETGSVVLGIIARNLLPMTEKGGVNLSVTSLVAILALFVLARVFEQGTQMRTEIEGTV
jgi:hypothetical protein